MRHSQTTCLPTAIVFKELSKIVLGVFIEYFVRPTNKVYHDLTPQPRSFYRELTNSRQTTLSDLSVSLDTTTLDYIDPPVCLSRGLLVIYPPPYGYFSVHSGNRKVPAERF